MRGPDWDQLAPTIRDLRPYPESSEAVAMGCCCAVAKRRGLPQYTRAGSPIFAIVRGCPVHDNPARELVVWDSREAAQTPRGLPRIRLPEHDAQTSAAPATLPRRESDCEITDAALAGFVFHGTSINEARVREIYTCAFLQGAYNVAFIGSTGTGKTRLAQAIANKATDSGKRGYFLCAFDLVTRLEREAASGGTFAFDLERADFLVIDELGYLPISPAGKAQLYRLLARLHERTSVIVTTHLSFERWDRMFDNPDLTLALVDRFVSRCHIVETGTESWRCRQDRRAARSTQKLTQLSNVLEHKRDGRKAHSVA